MPDPDRSERVALNESRFRDINDRVRSELEQLRETPERIRFVCECGNLDCREQLVLSPGAYERARADPMLFVIAPGHEMEEVEDVVERGDGFSFVRKHGDVAPIVRSTDPRR